MADSVVARLAELTHDQAYETEAKDVPLLENSSLAAPYYVVHFGAGDPVVEPDLAGCAVELDWDFQVTCAAGVTTDVLALVDRVMAKLFRWTPVVAGFSPGRLTVPPGYKPSVQLDRQVTPHRPYVALQFTSIITTA
jgi:hypothetical protein